MIIWTKKIDHGMERKLKEGDWGKRFVQFDLMKGYGLKPNHYFLDIGCGWLRGGFEFIKYLDVGHYYAIEPMETHLELGLCIVDHFGLENKRPILAKEKYFDISEFGRKFDFMLAQSVFTHLHPDMIKLAINRLIPHLKSNGKFYATFFGPSGFEGYEGEKVLKREDYYIMVGQPFRWYQEICEGICDVKLLGGFGHPYGKQIMEFTNAGGYDGTAMA